MFIALVQILSKYQVSYVYLITNIFLNQNESLVSGELFKSCNCSFCRHEQWQFII